MADSERTTHLPIDDGVQYRPIEGWPGYLVGDDGSVWSQKNGRWGTRGTWRRVRPSVSSSGHLLIGLSRRNPAHRYTHKVHHLVLTAFVGPKPVGMEGCHFNGNPADNNLSNLRWDTRQSNIADAGRHGTTPKGERHSAARLTTGDVQEIRRMAAAGDKIAVIGEKFNISISTVSAVVLRKRWRHVP